MTTHDNTRNNTCLQMMTYDILHDILHDNMITHDNTC